jgi:predicted TIM-barrel fold metal-dependent hydrolase
MRISRRALLAAPLPLLAAGDPIIDTHIHLFSADLKAFPFHKNAVYRPQPEPVEAYAKFAMAAGLAGAVIVHPEPYQDDHRYLEYCFQKEPRKDFFKGTVLFDPLNPQTPARVKQLLEKWPGRITALRVHRYTDPTKEPATMGAIRDRDLTSEAVRKTLRAIADLKLMLQFHAIPVYAPQIARLAEEATGTTVIVDHLCRAGQGTPEQWDSVVRLHRRPNVVMKISGIPYSSKQPWPHLDAKPYIRELYDTFGPSRLIWGGVGKTVADFKKAQEQFEQMFDFASGPSKALIRGRNAERLYGWTRETALL